MKLKIKEPCQEDWSKMTSNDYKIGLNSRHCDSCVKSVMDFTESSRAEIITYMLSSQGKSVCGRMRSDQFDFRHEDIPVLMETLHRQRTANPFLVLALVCMSLSACAQQEVESQIKTPPPVEHHHKIGKMVAMPIVEEIPDTVAVEHAILEQGEIYLGEVEAEEPVLEESSRENKIYKYTQQMPEYPGGIGKMTTFIQDNVRYTAAQAILGTVYVRFVVEADGNIMKPTIARGVHKILDQEALRLVQSMPKWVPGEKDGRKVAVYMTVPVRFEK
ncbi:MAG: TonB family protein [Flavobacteriaceae bacterium]|jgi:TonB family protein